LEYLVHKALYPLQPRVGPLSQVDHYHVQLPHAEDTGNTENGKYTGWFLLGGLTGTLIGSIAGALHVTKISQKKIARLNRKLQQKRDALQQAQNFIAHQQQTQQTEQQQVQKLLLEAAQRCTKQQQKLDAKRNALTHAETLIQQLMLQKAEDLAKLNQKTVAINQAELMIQQLAQDLRDQTRNNHLLNWVAINGLIPDGLKRVRRKMTELPDTLNLRRLTPTQTLGLLEALQRFHNTPEMLNPDTQKYYTMAQLFDQNPHRLQVNGERLPLRGQQVAMDLHQELLPRMAQNLSLFNSDLPEYQLAAWYLYHQRLEGHEKTRQFFNTHAKEQSIIQFLKEYSSRYKTQHGGNF
jgi:hypothetical protein